MHLKIKFSEINSNEERSNYYLFADVLRFDQILGDRFNEIVVVILQVVFQLLELIQRFLHLNKFWKKFVNLIEFFYIRNCRETFLVLNFRVNIHLRNFFTLAKCLFSSHSFLDLFKQFNLSVNFRALSVSLISVFLMLKSSLKKIKFKKN